MFVQLEVLYFAQPLKLKFKASPLLRFDYYGTRVTHPASIFFLIKKRSYLNLHLPFVAFRNFFLLVYRQNYSKNTVS
jgi:hypothetical protein